MELVLEGDPSMEVTPEVPESTRSQLRRGQAVGKAHKRPVSPGDRGKGDWSAHAHRAQVLASHGTKHALRKSALVLPRVLPPVVITFLGDCAVLAPFPPQVSQRENYRCRETKQSLSSQSCHDGALPGSPSVLSPSLPVLLGSATVDVVGGGGV